MPTGKADRRRAIREKRLARTQQPTGHGAGHQPPPPPPPEPLGFFRRFWKQAVGAAIIALGFWGFVANTAQLAALFPLGPDITANPVQSDDPFVVRFGVKNPMWLSDMHDVSYACVLKEVRNDGINFRDVPLDVQDPPFRIEAGVRKNILCRFNEFFGLPKEWKFSVAVIKLELKYRAWGFSRTADATFRWDQGTRNWVEGE